MSKKSYVSLLMDALNYRIIAASFSVLPMLCAAGIFMGHMAVDGRMRVMPALLFGVVVVAVFWLTFRSATSKWTHCEKLRESWHVDKYAASSESLATIALVVLEMMGGPIFAWLGMLEIMVNNLYDQGTELCLIVVVCLNVIGLYCWGKGVSCSRAIAKTDFMKLID